MPHDVTMPQLGMAQDAGKIVSWFKAPGDAVAKGDALFEVETDKATMEVEAHADGFLSRVTAAEGDDVPVGVVIACISETAGEDAATTDTAPAEDAKTRPVQDGMSRPEGDTVTMPQLGMAQDTGLLVTWLKTPGDKVAADDVLFEVETDKSTMEVEAGRDGWLAATLAEPGEEVPVGDPVAIISDARPDAPVARSVKNGAKAEAPAKAEAAKPAAAKAPAPKPPAPVTTGGHILASPKARRLALEQGLDLGRLVEAGHPQPFHVGDLEVLRAMPVQAAERTATSARRLTADLPIDGSGEFAEWAAESANLKDANALLAGLVAASLGRDQATIEVESFGQSRAYNVPATAFSNITTAEEDTTPDLILRDLRMSRVSTVNLGAED